MFRKAGSQFIKMGLFKARNNKLILNRMLSTNNESHDVLLGAAAVTGLGILGAAGVILSGSFGAGFFAGRAYEKSKQKLKSEVIQSSNNKKLNP